MMFANAGIGIMMCLMCETLMEFQSVTTIMVGGPVPLLCSGDPRCLTWRRSSSHPRVLDALSGGVLPEFLQEGSGATQLECILTLRGMSVRI